jgi:hypothetical protein
MQLSVISEAFSKQLAKKLAESLRISESELREFVKNADVDPNRLPYGDWIAKALHSIAKADASLAGMNDDDDGVAYYHELSRLFDRSGQTIKSVLQRFDAIKDRARNTGHDTNINNYSLGQLEALVAAVESESVSKSEGGIDSFVKKLDGVEHIGSFSGHDVYKVSDADALKQIGEGTKWCTRGSYSYGSRADQYIDDHGYLFVLMQKNKPIMQVCSDLSEPHDRENEPITIPEKMMRIILDHVRISATNINTIIEAYTSIYGDANGDLSPEGREHLINNVSGKMQEKAMRLASGEQEKTSGWGSLATPKALNLDYFSSLMIFMHRSKRGRWKEIEPFVIQCFGAATYIRVLNEVKQPLPADEQRALLDQQIRYVISQIQTAGDQSRLANMFSESEELSALRSYVKGMVRQRAIFSTDLEMLAEALVPAFQSASAAQNNELVLESIASIFAELATVVSPEVSAKFGQVVLTNTKIAVYYYITANGADTDETPFIPRWPELEARLLENPVSYAALKYLVVLEERWPEWEKVAFTARTHKSQMLTVACLSYMSRFGMRRWDDLEQLIFKEPLLHARQQEHTAAMIYMRLAEMRTWPEYAASLKEYFYRQNGAVNKTEFFQAILSTNSKEYILGDDEFLRSILEKPEWAGRFAKVIGGRWSAFEEKLFRGDYDSDEAADAAKAYLLSLTTSNNEQTIPNLAANLQAAGIEPNQIGGMMSRFPAFFGRSGSGFDLVMGDDGK